MYKKTGGTAGIPAEITVTAGIPAEITVTAGIPAGITAQYPISISAGIPVGDFQPGLHSKISFVIVM